MKRPNILNQLHDLPGKCWKIAPREKSGAPVLRETFHRPYCTRGDVRLRSRPRRNA